MTLDNITELESHLLDEIDELEQLGLNTEESLLIAKNRIGNTKELTAEFGKVNKNIYFRNKVIPYLKGILLFMAFITITNLLANLSLIIATNIGIDSENLNYVSIGILIFSSLILSILAYNKYQNTNLNFKKFTNIPTLISVVLVSKILTFLSLPLITRSIGISDYGSLLINLNVYNLLFGLFILTISFVVFYVSKKENKVKISE
tara:strand:+ start:531 stop:1145 length:615 start_codon:yes stop_codon:yes gene_type:complete